MKKIILSLVIVMSGFCSYAQVYDTGNNVGIGTPTPQEKLEVTGNQKLFGDLIFGSDQTAYFIHGPGNGGAIRLRTNITQAVDRNVQIGNINNNGTWFSFFTVAETGNVGIGTTNPATKLDVVGGTIQVTNPNPTYGLIDNSNANYSWSVQNTAGAYRFYDNTANAERMRITSLGNVLIGQASQSNSAYKLDVWGKARANEIVVNTSGADFVFDKQYVLPKLSDVKAYIDKNQHLPEIPSAKEMQTNGMGVGEINTKLLQKVEELTLYAIQQQEENEKLKAENRKLKESQQKVDQAQEARIAALEKALLKLTENQSK